MSDHPMRPIAALHVEEGKPSWEIVTALFKRYGQPPPTAPLRDQLANHFLWARYAVALEHQAQRTLAEGTYQDRVARWMLACFNPEIAADVVERNDRFLEEALELTQANGYSADRAHALVDYVFGRDVGDPDQEVGGVLVTLAALCNTAGLDMDGAGLREIERIEAPEIMDKIRRKQAAKPTGSALPIASKES